MKKKKLSLDALEVKSFVTSFDSENSGTIRGGACPPNGDHSRLEDGCFSARACTDLGAGGNGCFVDGRTLSQDECY